MRADSCEATISARVRHVNRKKKRVMGVGDLLVLDWCDGCNERAPHNDGIVLIPAHSRSEIAPLHSRLSAPLWHTLTFDALSALGSSGIEFF